VGAWALVDPSARFAAVQVAEGEKTPVSLAQKAGGLRAQFAHRASTPALSSVHLAVAGERPVGEKRDGVAVRSERGQNRLSVQDALLAIRKMQERRA
jgi:hypothetical protein